MNCLKFCNPPPSHGLIINKSIQKIKNNLTKTDTIKVEYLNKNDLIEEYGLIGQLEKIENRKNVQHCRGFSEDRRCTDKKVFQEHGCLFFLWGLRGRASRGIGKKLSSMDGLGKE